MKNIEDLINISEIVTFYAKNTPSQTAILTQNGTKISYEQYEEYINSVAVFLLDNGVKKGDNVICLLKSELLIAVSILALAKIGATVVSVQRGISNTLLEQVVNETKSKILLSDLPFNNSLDLKYISISRKEIIKKRVLDENLISKEIEQPWQIVVGSGSTGLPKLFPVSHEIEKNRCILSRNWIKLVKEDVVTTFTGLSYTSSKRRFFETLYVGATFLLLQRYTSNSINLCKIHNVSVLYTTPFHTEQILKRVEPNSKEVLNFLKVFSLGSSVVRNELRKDILEKLTKNLYIRYGTNEIGSICNTSLYDNANLLNSVGKPLKGVLVEIVDSKGNKKNINEVGYIRVKSPGMIKNYLNNIEVQKKTIKDGWFYPGDVGKFVKTGELIHLGRSDNMMIMNGINIYPSAIENVMLKYEGIKDAVVFPFKNKVSHEIPVCALVIEDNLVENDLYAYVDEYLGVSRPRRFFFLDEIPRNPQGKVIYPVLKQVIMDALKQE